MGAFLFDVVFCPLKLSDVSLVTPRIFVECLCGIAVLSSVSCGVC